MRLSGHVNGRLTLLAAAVAAFTCHDVAPITLGECGNGVLEPSRGEDCDSATVGIDTVCQPPGAVNACRYTCRDLTTGAANPCPSGWGCGKDGICRAHSSALQPPEVVAASARGLFLNMADFDGDGLDDISWLFADRLEATYVKATTTSTVERAVRALSVPTIGDPNLDGRADWLIPNLNGVVAFRGNSDGQPRPTTFQPIPLTLEVLQFIPIDLIPDVVVFEGTPYAFAGDESLLVRNDDDRIAAFNDEIEITGEVDESPGVFLNSAVAAEFDTTRDPNLIPPGVGTPQELALARGDRNEVDVYRPTLAGATVDGQPTISLSFTDTPVTTIALDATPTRLLGAHQMNPAAVGTDSAIGCGATQAPGDSHLDLVIQAQVGGQERTYVAYGLGDGTFHSDPCALADVPATVAADNRADQLLRFELCDAVLDVGHLDSDGSIDIVTASGVWLTSLLGAPEAPGACSDMVPFLGSDFGLWTQARIGDFNGDGHEDVLATATFSGLDFVAGSGSTKLTPTHFGSATGVTHMTVGDMDADGVQDAVISELGADQLVHISAIFGEYLSVPADPVEIGSVEGLFLLEAFDVGGASPDEIDDLVIGRTPTEDDADQRPFVGLVDGATDRQLSSSYIQAYSFNDVDFYAPIASAYGRFQRSDQVQLGMVGLRFASFDDPSLPPWGLGVADIRGNLSFGLLGDSASPLDAHPFDVLRTVAAAAVDVDGDDRDELFVVSSGLRTSTSEDADSNIRLFVRSLDEAGWTGGPALTVDDTSFLDGNVQTGDIRNQRALPATTAPQVCYLDPSGAPSVVLSVLERNPCTAEFEAPRTVLYVLSASLLDAIRQGQPAAIPAEARIAVPHGQSIVGFTCFNGDSDADDEIALLLLNAETSTCDAPLPAEGDDAPALTGAIHVIDVIDGQAQTPISFYALTGAHAESLDKTEDSGVPPLSGLASGDVNGDGVDDLVVGARDVNLVLRGLPVTP
jgi:FG-GAP-like repeat